VHITNKISKVFHKFATTEFSPTIQSIINNGYVRLLCLDMKDFDKPESYKTLNKLFTRALKEPREFDESSDTFISPTDSFVSETGKIEDDTVLQIKGMKYSLNELLTLNIEDKNYQKLRDGSFMNFYLSPKDYHRYHLSYDCQILKLVHIPGKLYSVNFRYLNKKENLFIENERVVMECKTQDDKLFYMVFVGALNVGKMVFEFEPKINTNSDTTQIQTHKYDNLFMKKGDCLGYFEMGSTVLMFWEKDSVELEELTNQKVKFTDIVAKRKWQ